MSVKNVPIIVGGGGYKLSEAKVSLDDQTRLLPLVRPVFVGKFNGLQIASIWVIVIEAVRFQFLEIGSGSHCPVIVDKPSD